jgi:hypothetical protein
MSKPWRITRGDQQFTVKDVAELKLMAVGGKIHASDLIQPPGGTDWLYATEVPELKGLIKIKAPDDDDDEWSPRRALLPMKLLRVISGLLFVGIVVMGFFALWIMYQGAPSAEDYSLFGEHEGALSPLDALATESANLLAEPDSRSSKVGVVEKDDRVALIRKLGDFYEVETQDRKTGWVGIAQVIPGYLFDQTMADKYDPLFNPDTYLMLANYAWTPVGEEDLPETLTEMQFQLDNPTEYGMQGVILKITFYDSGDRVLDVKNFEVPRLVPPQDSLHVEGIQVDIAWDEDTRAEVDIVGARALLPAEFSRLKAEEDARIAAELEVEGEEIE